MKNMRWMAFHAVIVMLAMVACTGGGGGNLIPDAPVVHAAAPAKSMRPFRSDKELAAYLREIAEKEEREQRARQTHSMTGVFSKGASASAPTAMPANPQNDASSARAGAEESVTNVQHAGVDEGGIVKVHGNHLVVLRRGRLFTVAIGGNALTPISSIDAYGPEIDPSGTWYDEMLVSKDTVVVIGYSYERGGTEVGLFQIDQAGNLAYRSTYHLRSNDYYSSRNYASRLIGHTLIFYAPEYIYSWRNDPFQSFPAVRRWHKGATPEEFRRIAPATQVYKAEYPLDYGYGTTLHTVTTCDLSDGNFDCKATSVIGPRGRVFYVSPSAVYVWVTARGYESMVYRMPLDGSSPSALRVSGSPMDQFSFLESEDGYLNVLLRHNGYGDSMWNAEGTVGDVQLLRLPLTRFSDGSEPARDSDYLNLPAPHDYTFHNRFVGDYVLYGTGSGWGSPQHVERSVLYATRWSNGHTHQVQLNHGVDRIEQMGSNAVVVGTDGEDLHFSAISLASSPAVESEYIRKGASQGELRSHGFFYKPDGQETGMLGLPVSVPGRPGYKLLFEDSAAVLFLRNDSLHFREAGELEAQPDKAVDDACRASCVDWYGNSQPLFVRGRVIALLGYELVEGRVEAGRIHEVRRVNYAPQGLSASERKPASVPVN